MQKYEPRELHATERDYSEEGFWRKLNRFARVAGREVVERALWLYYAYQRPETPAWAKRVVLGALAYMIVPFDAITDLLPGIGFTDDLGVLAVAVSTVAAYINDDVKRRANLQAEQWFGPRADAESRPTP